MDAEDAGTAETTLDMLEPGRGAVVVALTNAGTERRRMLDLGILPGTPIELEMVSPLGDPRAYRIRGTVIALRRQQARAIRISLKERQERADVDLQEKV